MWTHQDSLTAALVAITAYYAWEARQSRLILEAERNDRNEQRAKEKCATDDRAASALRLLHYLQVYLSGTEAILGQMRTMDTWMHQEFKRLMDNAPFLRGLSAEDTDDIRRILHAMEDLSKPSLALGQIEYDTAKAWALERNSLIEKVRQIVVAVEPIYPQETRELYSTTANEGGTITSED